MQAWEEVRASLITSVENEIHSSPYCSTQENIIDSQKSGV